MQSWTALDVQPSTKWVDDVTLFHFPSATHTLSDGSTVFDYHYDRQGAKDLIASLGVPWHSSKGQDFDFSFTYVGFFWDIPARTVCLTDVKHQKIILKLQLFLDDFQHRLLDQMRSQPSWLLIPHFLHLSTWALLPLLLIFLHCLLRPLFLWSCTRTLPSSLGLVRFTLVAADAAAWPRA
jgi:hypothetical protein